MNLAIRVDTAAPIFCHNNWCAIKIAHQFLIWIHQFFFFKQYRNHVLRLSWLHLNSKWLLFSCDTPEMKYSPYRCLHTNTFLYCMMTSSNGNISRITGHLFRSPVTGEFPAQRPVTRSFDVFFALRLNKWLSKQSWGWWFETPSSPFWRHSYE